MKYMLLTPHWWCRENFQVLSQWPHVTVNEHYLTLDGRSENYRKLKSIYLNPMTQPEKFIFGLAFLFSYLSNIPLPDYSNCLWWWHPTPVLLPGKSHGQRSLVGCSPWVSRHDWATSFSLFTFMHWRRKWQPTPVFLPGESQGRETWWAAVFGVAQSQTRLKWLSSSS